MHAVAEALRRITDMVSEPRDGSAQPCEADEADGAAEGRLVSSES